MTRPAARALRLFLLLAAVAAPALPAAAQSCQPALQPPAILVAGELSMAINPTLPPQQFIDEKGQLQGLNFELGSEVARKLCLTPKFIRMDFPAMIPGLGAGRFDIINTGLFWTEERSKTMFLVPYALQAISIVVMEKNPLGLKSIDDLAGRSVSVETNTYTERKTKELSDALVAKGLKPITIRGFNTATESFSALKAGQVDAGMNLDETAIDLVRRGGVVRIANGLGGSQITFAFKSKPLAEAFAKALGETKADGFYDKVFDKFGMTRLTEATFAIRGPGPAQ
ncbi:ABC transporter substrate-binding protein [Prosthecomicrobium sp. N25]|uniref:ABC transporter substrate-binding protein n=1 Tax=Prosthecomicrobium sp. N25 TaxID=3129254 RepID=UPI003076886A